jgi:hypothetical protein
MSGYSLEKLGLMLESKAEQGVTAMKVQFGADVGAMVFNGSSTYMQLSGDLRTRLCVCNKLQDTPFSLAEVIQIRLLRKKSLCTLAAAE